MVTVTDGLHAHRGMEEPQYVKMVTHRLVNFVMF